MNLSLGKSSQMPITSQTRREEFKEQDSESGAIATCQFPRAGLVAEENVLISSATSAGTRLGLDEQWEAPVTRAHPWVLSTIHRSTLLHSSTTHLPFCFQLFSWETD